MNTGILSSPKCKVAVSTIFVTMFLFAFVFAQPVTSYEQTPQPGTYQSPACEQMPNLGAYQNISVQVAHQMITRDHHNQILIMDVRYQCEYDLGHLYGAVLMPYNQLQANISEFQAYKNQVIIVYCKTGVRSTIASEILANNGFTRVYNMVGGIFAWINAGYQIYTTCHYATVNKVDDRILTHIEPLLLLQTGSAPCTQNQTCSSNSSGSITNFNYTVLEQDESHIGTRITYEVNGIGFEFNTARTLLWSYNVVSDGYNRTANFVSTEISGQNSFAQFYSLEYLVQCAKYNLTIETVLAPLNSKVYNSSATMMTLIPASNSGPSSLEYIGFNSSVTLSGQYAILGMVAQKIGKLYAQSRDENLTRLAQSYYCMSGEADYLSNLVKAQLQGYDNRVLKTLAIFRDASIWDCFQCFGEILLLYFAMPQCFSCVACLVPCFTIFTFWWCLGCLAVPCVICILSLMFMSHSCCLCRENLGYGTCPW